MLLLLPITPVRVLIILLTKSHDPLLTEPLKNKISLRSPLRGAY